MMSLWCRRRMLRKQVANLLRGVLAALALPPEVLAGRLRLEGAVIGVGGRDQPIEFGGSFGPVHTVNMVLP